MEPAPPKDPSPEADRASKPGGTLLRFKRLTNHLFGVGKPADTDEGKK